MCSTSCVTFGNHSELSSRAQILRIVHSSIGIFELGCLMYLWLCAITRRRDGGLYTAVTVLFGEGAALLIAKGCPLGIFQRRVGDNVPMFELWFGPRLARFAIPGFASMAVAGLTVLIARPPVDPRW